MSRPSRLIDSSRNVRFNVRFSHRSLAIRELALARFTNPGRVKRLLS
jgi:hypothetical protein